MRKSLFWVITFIVLILACNMPGIAGPGTGSTPTPAVYVTILVATPTPGDGSPAITPPADLTTTPTPNLTVTTTPSVTLTPTGTLTLTPKPTSKGPTATPTFAPLGPPLGFGNPAWELVSWHEIAGANDWEGVIRIHAIGGVPPYRYQVEDKPISDSLDVVMRWRLCKPMPGTIRVWSADGQEAHTSIWVWELGCKN